MSKSNENNDIPAIPLINSGISSPIDASGLQTTYHPAAAVAVFTARLCCAEKLLIRLLPENKIAEISLTRQRSTAYNLDAAATALAAARPADQFGIVDLSKFAFSLKVSASTCILIPAAGNNCSQFYERLLIFAENLKDSLHLSLENIPLLSKKEHEAVTQEWIAAERDYDLNLPLIRRFEKTAYKQPDAPAVSESGKVWTYEKLNRRADDVAACLFKNGIAGNQVIGIYSNKSAETLALLLGAFKAGCAYLPIEPGRYPRERLEYMLNSAGVEIILQGTFTNAPHANKVSTLKVIDYKSIKPSAGPLKNIALSTSNIAYIIFTSGSTGKPKGVKITQRNLLNHNLSIIEKYRLAPDSRILQFSTFSFDVFCEEVYPALLLGANLFIAPQTAHESPYVLLDYIAVNAISLINIPTSYWHELAGAITDRDLPVSLKTVVIGDEKAFSKVFRSWQQRYPEVRLINAYGLTETTITCTMGENAHTIGKSIANTRVSILDRWSQQLPAGMLGEICISGECVCAGYLGDQNKNAEVFLTDPLFPDSKIFHTGDLGKFDANMEIVFKGRADSEIKLRGFRIDPAEIESVLRECSNIKDAAIAVCGNTAKILTAFLVINDKTTGLAVNNLKAVLRKKLPGYMIPKHFRILPRLPLTPNMKVNRKLLAASEVGTEAEITSSMEVNSPLEIQVYSTFKAILGYGNFDNITSFFELGGDSLSAIKLLLQLEENTGAKIPFEIIYQYSSIKELSEFIAQNQEQVSIPRNPLVLSHNGSGKY
ncbi:non-ribosomal peptide synthetase [Lentisphaerota bacterium ZTH]|nr:non-ribosomal peptide synthetase [Lentisphaerota bacterium]WET07393.1 non-ribosomal peptide synthetase [Lentisphaerota bacterium ZTH]